MSGRWRHLIVTTPDGLALEECDARSRVCRVWSAADLAAREASLAPVLAELLSLLEAQRAADAEALAGVVEPVPGKAVGALTVGSGA